MQKTAQGDYVVMAMTAKNVGKQSQSCFGDNQKLKTVLAANTLLTQWATYG